MRAACVLILLVGCSSGYDSPLDVGFECGELPQRPPPSGKTRLAYLLRGADHRELWVVDLDAATPQPVRLDAAPGAPGTIDLEDRVSPYAAPFRWKPGGRELVVRDESGEAARLALIDVSEPGVVRPIFDGAPAPGDFPRTGFDHPNDRLWSPDGGRILFADRAGSLWIVDAAPGSLPERLTPDDVPWWQWSPDGRFIAYSDDAIEANLRVAHIEGTTEVATETVGRGNRGIWSPDASKIVVKNNGPEIERVWSLATGELVEVEITAAVWAPDASWLATIGYHPRPTIFLTGACGFGTPFSPTGPESDWLEATNEIEVTADGAHLVYARTGRMWAVDVAGWSHRLLYETDGRETNAQPPSVAPSGGRAGWMAGRMGTEVVVTDDRLAEAYVLDVSDDSVGAQLGTPRFSPDGRRAVYQHHEPYRLHVVDLADPSMPVELGVISNPYDAAFGSVRWAPDGSWLAWATGTEPAEIQVARVTDAGVEAPLVLGWVDLPSEAALAWEP